jgi:glucuronoarabinoxylan endo-1,4-beta-xylanase
MTASERPSSPSSTQVGFLGQRRACWATLIFAGFGLGCATDRRAVDDVPLEELLPEPVVVDFGTLHQRITGFGASSAWTAPTMSEEMADRFFSEEDGLGLSLLRIQIKPSGESFELETAQLATARGARVWAAPWSPPGEWKTNGMARFGGSLLPEYYDDWAESLARFAESMTDGGVPLLAISAQNEPDYAAEWETCEWTPEALATFIGDHLGPALEARGLDTPVLAPETANWGSFARYGDAILGNAKARDFVSAVATHSYSGSAFAYETPGEHGKEIWETEVSDPGSAEGPPMDTGLRTARLIHDHLTVANANAWHYWWLVPRLDSETETTGALLDLELQLTRRGYALGHYSKFVRPGFVRVSASDTTTTGSYASAYIHPETGRFAIVAVNERRGDVEQTFEFEGGSPEQVTPWVTSADVALAEQPELRVRGNSLTVTLEARSMVTLVGSLGDAPPPDAG